MPLLYPYLSPTAQPSKRLVAKRRPRNMSQAEFYRTQLGLDDPLTSTDRSERDFPKAPSTSDFIAGQNERYANRPAIPELQPGARVKNPDLSMVAPSTFQKYYEQLATINRTGQEMLAAEQARSAAARVATTSPGAVQRPAGGGGQAYGSGVPSNPAANFKYAQAIAPQYGWSGNELSAWYTLGMKESGWRNTAQNPTSTAYGIGQFLNSTWGTVGGVKTSDPQAQVNYMAKYIKQRYGSPSRALAFHLANNWY